MSLFSQICRSGIWGGLDWAVLLHTAQARGISALYSVFTELLCTVREGFSCLSAFLEGPSARLRSAESLSLLKMSQSISSVLSLHKGSHPLYIMVWSSKGRKQKMPTLLKARLVIGIVSVSLYANSESHELTDFKETRQRCHLSMGREFMNLQPVLICHKHNNSSHHILFFTFPVLLFIFFI